MGDRPESAERDLGRFRILGTLGAGGMGVVYRARDREREDAIVAVKVLRHMDARALYRFKNEFRSLADLVHPNLVTLYDLVAVGGEWFVTMECVDGVGFLEYARPSGGGLPRPPETAPTRRDVPLNELSETESVAMPGDTRSTRVSVRSRISGPAASSDSVVDEARLRRALPQLVRGLSTLHAAGRLHRDIKASNVLVSREGRVVICDFGLVTPIDRGGHSVTAHDQVVGTVAYMSPEQAAAQPLTEASDWYSVGVLLYLALTGRYPFEGTPDEVMRFKQHLDPPAPSALDSRLPEDLSELCISLLSRRPDLRPTGPDLLRHVAGVDPSTTETPRAALSLSPLPLIGRDAHTDALQDAFDAMQSERRVVTLAVSGPSGMGKTALVRGFLDDVRSRDGAVVLEGRCYECEALPYKALDSLVDDLSSYLARLPPEEASELLPRDVAALGRLFPVVRRVEVAPGDMGVAIPDPHELRRRAFGALRELLRNVARETPLVLFIDDVQWGDADSAALLGEVLRPPDPPPLLLVAAHRAEDIEQPALQALRGVLASPGVDARSIDIGPLVESEARELALALLGSGNPSASEHAGAIARECGGNPYFVHELVRHVRARSQHPQQPAVARAVRLEDVLVARLVDLPDSARSLLELAAVAGRPIPTSVAAFAAGLHADASTPTAVLRAERLIRTRRVRDRELVEPYHDRIRETIAARVAPDIRRRYHQRIALAMEAGHHADVEALFDHWLSAGDRARAAGYAVPAAEQASRALAFDRAARLYQAALTLGGSDPDREHSLRIKLGGALENAGRGAEAAAAYLAAAGGAPAVETLELRRRAAFQLLRSGHFDDGLTTLREVLGAVGLTLARSPRTALVATAARRAYVRLRGLRFRRREVSQVAPEQLTRIDVCWSGTMGLGMVDTLRGADFQSRHLLLALRAGEPYRVTQALAVEVGFRSLTGTRRRGNLTRLADKATSLAEELGRPELIGLVTGMRGLADYQLGRFEPARVRAEEAVRVFREECTGVAFELVTAELYVIWSLFYLGHLGELSRRVHALRQEAEERGDLYAASMLRIGIPGLVWLFADDPDGAARSVSEFSARWSHEGFHLQHYWSLLAEVHGELYAGDAATAHRRVCGAWRALRQSQLLRIQMLRIESLHLRARCAIATATAGADNARQLLREAERDADRIRRENTMWANDLARLLDGSAAAARGDTDRAITALAAAERGLANGGLTAYEMLARRRRGELLDGNEGAALVAEADCYLADEGVSNTARLARLLVP